MATRKEQKEALRAERIERERAETDSSRRKRIAGIGAGVALAVAAVAVLLGVFVFGADGGGGGGASAGPGEFPQGSVPPQRTADLDGAARAAGCEVLTERSEGNDHVTSPVTYRSNPPHSGDHFPEAAEDAAYLESPPLEPLVHSLEHGRIFIQYLPTTPPALVGSLKALYDEDPYHIVLAPNTTDMPYEVAATAWTHVLGCRQMNDRVYDAIRAFKVRYRDRGPEFVP